MQYTRICLLSLPILMMSCEMYGDSKSRFKNFEMNDTIRYGSMFTLEVGASRQGLICEIDGERAYPHLVFYNLRGQEAVVGLSSRMVQTSQWTPLFEYDLIGTVNKEVFQLDKEYTVCANPEEAALTSDVSAEECQAFHDLNADVCGTDSGRSDCDGAYEIAVELISGENILVQAGEDCMSVIEVDEDVSQ